MASRAFCRGAGFEGHREALEHEARLLERAAADKHAHAARLREKLQKRAEATTISKGKGANFLAAQIKSTQAMLTKTLDEAAFYDRQVLTARRYIESAPSQEETPVCPPSPADSLHKELADVSQESSQQSSLPSSSPDEVDNISAPAQQPRTGGAASSRLDLAQDSDESGHDTAHSQPPRDYLKENDTGQSDTSPSRMEPASPMSVSPITAPATSQETYGTEKATDSQQGGTSSRSQRSTSDSASTPKGRQASRHRSSPKASPKPHSARKAATTGKTTTVRTTKTRKGARG